MKTNVQRVLNTDVDPIAKFMELLTRAVDHRHRVLHKEASVLLNDMEVAIHRIEKHGEAAALGDIKVAAWHKAATEVRVLKQARRALEAIMAGVEPDDALFEGPRNGHDDE